MKREHQIYLLQEIPKGEALLKQVKENSEPWSVLVRTLTKMYRVLCQELKKVCEDLNYPLEQENWKDSAPLEKLAEEFPGIEVLDWYQRQLGMMLMPSNHPWYRIL